MLSRILYSTLQAEQERQRKREQEAKASSSTRRARRGVRAGDSPFEEPSKTTNNVDILRQESDKRSLSSSSSSSSSPLSDSALPLTKNKKNSSGTVTVGLGSNDGQAFGLADRKSRSLSSMFSAPSAGTLLLRGFDLDDTNDDPKVPHRQASSSPSFARGALAALFQSTAGGGRTGASNTATSAREHGVEFDHHHHQDQQTTSNNSSSSHHEEFATSGSQPHQSPWYHALQLAATNIARRGGERSSDDIETSLAALLSARRRREAFDLFSQNSDVPLDEATYDQLLRTFVTDRDHALEILAAMERHAVLSDVLRKGERTSLAQAVFESMSLHDWRRALDAFQQHYNVAVSSNSSTGSVQKQQQQREEDDAISGPTSRRGHPPPVYSGLLVALLRRGLKQEALLLVDALSGSDAQKDVATGLIRCLHAESDELEQQNLAGATSPEGKLLLPLRHAIDFTAEWLKQQQQQQQIQGEAKASHFSVAPNIQFFERLMLSGGVREHAQSAVRVFATHPNAFTCAALVKFLLSQQQQQQQQPEKENDESTATTTPILREAIALSLFPRHQQHQTRQNEAGVNATATNNSNNSSSAASTFSSYLFASAASSPLSLSSSSASAAGAAAVSAYEASAIHFARVSVARAIMRRGHWSLALSMAQNCLRARSFDPVAQLARTVARSGRWNAALRIGTQLFALRRTAPTASELSMCVHASLWSSKWSSALFWVERAHSRGLKFDPAVYDAAFSAAAAAAAAHASTFSSNNNNNTSVLAGVNSDVLRSASLSRGGFAEAASFSLHENPMSSSSGASDAAINQSIRTVKCMAESGGTCSSASIERLIAAAAAASSPSSSSSAATSGGESMLSPAGNNSSAGGDAPRIIDALCDANVIDWKL